MPVMAGIKTACAMRASTNASTRQTPLLGLTANVSTLDLYRFKDAGLDGLLLKPFETLRSYSEDERLTAQVKHRALGPRLTLYSDSGPSPYFSPMDMPIVLVKGLVR